MKPILVVFFFVAFLIPVLARTTWAQSTSPSPATPAQFEARQELNEAARSYREADFPSAQAHSERALAVDPENKSAPYFIARSIHAQFKPGVNSPENMAKAQEAIAAYQRILSRFPADEEAYKAVAYLYGATKQESLLLNWLLNRAADYSVAPEKRAEAYVVLASKDWDCSYKITELPISKVTTVSEGKAIIQYLKPEESEFSRARQCVDHGLEMAEHAIILTPENESAWAYKTNLLLESSKLAEMEKDGSRKAILMQQYQMALEQTTRVSQKGRQKD